MKKRYLLIAGLTALVLSACSSSGKAPETKATEASGTEQTGDIKESSAGNGTESDAADSKPSPGISGKDDNNENNDKDDKSGKGVKAEAPKGDAQITDAPGSSDTMDNWYTLNDDATELTVKLDGNSTTGYTWNYEIEDPEILKNTGAEYKEYDHKDGMVGVGGIWTATFEAASKDDKEKTTTVSFAYARSWEDDAICDLALELSVKDGKIEVTGEEGGGLRQK